MPRRRPRTPSVRPGPRGGSRARRTTLALVLAPLLLGGVAGCTGDDGGGDDSTPGPGAGVSTAAAPRPAVTRTRIEHVEGRLPDADRARLRERVQESVDAWIDAAYAGDYPRTDFSAAYATFTDRAAALARADAGLTSNAEIGGELDAVRPRQRTVGLDVLAVDGRAAAVTARVRLVLELTGGTTRTEAVTGSLYLTYESAAGSSGWRVFGYDLTRKEIR